MRAHLIPGIRSMNGGATAALAPYFAREGFEPMVYDYGYARGVFSRFQNGSRARTIARNVRPEDILVGHSNGGTLSWMVQNITPVAGMVLIHPALDEDVRFKRAGWVDVYHCRKDFVVDASEVLGFFDLVDHPYGRLGNCGYRGKDKHVVSIDDELLTIDMVKMYFGPAVPALPPVMGHSEMFDATHFDAWAQFYARRSRERWNAWSAARAV